MIYRGRAVPLVRRVLEQGSTSAAYEIYKGSLDQAARLPPLHLLADRGFADIPLDNAISSGWAGIGVPDQEELLGLSSRAAPPAPEGKV